MRSEKDMLGLILRVAQGDDRVRAVYMNGSRANPNAPRDLFQDYDVVYAVTDIRSYQDSDAWIDVFGPRLMLQKPNWMDSQCGEPVDLDESCNYQMLFTDGNRIDLTLLALPYLHAAYTGDSLTLPLLDKDGLLPPIPPASDRDYRVNRRPQAIHFFATVNNFWWCLQNVAKGLARDEIPYAKEMFDGVVRGDMNRMLSWQIAQERAEPVSVGKAGKYFARFMPPQRYADYLSTYAGADRADCWRALFAACALFRQAAEAVAAALGFDPQRQDAEQMLSYLRRVSQLPDGATEIFPG